MLFPIHLCVSCTLFPLILKPIFDDSICLLRSSFKMANVKLKWCFGIYLETVIADDTHTHTKKMRSFFKVAITKCSWLRNVIKKKPTKKGVNNCARFSSNAPMKIKSDTIKLTKKSWKQYVWLSMVFWVSSECGDRVVKAEDFTSKKFQLSNIIVE